MRLQQDTPEVFLRQINSELDLPRSKISPQKVEAAARTFMKKRGLIKPGEEKAQFGVRTRWSAQRVVQFGGKDLIVMKREAQIQDQGKWVGGAGDGWEVLGIERSKTGYRLKTFEETFPLPARLKVGIGTDSAQGTSTHRLPPDLYYVELSGPSVGEALKSVFTKTFYFGFSADLIAGGGGKEPFDPTPRRTWKVANPVYDLRRGSTVEIYDVYAGQLDEDFAAYFEGSGNHVAPWSSSIRRVFVDGKWVDTMPDTGLPRGHANRPHEIEATTQRAKTRPSRRR